MATEVALQLEALKLLQQWSMWIITLSVAFIGTIGFAFKSITDRKQEIAAHCCVGFLLGTVVLAVFLVGAIPAIIQKLQPVIQDHQVILGANARGVYGELYLDMIPLWIIISAQRMTFLVGLFFGARLVWLKSNRNGPSINANSA